MNNPQSPKPDELAKIVNSCLLCNCSDAYSERGLIAPDCPRCQYAPELIERLEAGYAAATSRTSELEARIRLLESDIERLTAAVTDAGVSFERDFENDAERAAYWATRYQKAHKMFCEEYENRERLESQLSALQAAQGECLAEGWAIVDSKGAPFAACIGATSDEAFVAIPLERKIDPEIWKTCAIEVLICRKGRV